MNRLLGSESEQFHSVMLDSEDSSEWVGGLSADSQQLPAASPLQTSELSSACWELSQDLGNRPAQEPVLSPNMYDKCEGMLNVTKEEMENRVASLISESVECDAVEEIFD